VAGGVNKKQGLGRRAQKGRDEQRAREGKENKRSRVTGARVQQLLVSSLVPSPVRGEPTILSLDIGDRDRLHRLLILPGVVPSACSLARMA
jgi:hypothetical protein